MALTSRSAHAPRTSPRNTCSSRATRRPRSGWRRRTTSSTPSISRPDRGRAEFRQTSPQALLAATTRRATTVSTTATKARRNAPGWARYCPASASCSSHRRASHSPIRRASNKTISRASNASSRTTRNASRASSRTMRRGRSRNRSRRTRRWATSTGCPPSSPADSRRNRSRASRASTERATRIGRSLLRTGAVAGTAARATRSALRTARSGDGDANSRGNERADRAV